MLRNMKFYAIWKICQNRPTLIYTGCGSITSFFKTPSNSAVDMVAEWTWSHSLGPILKFSWKWVQSSAFAKSHSVVCNFLCSNCWALVFWRKWSHSYCEFRPICQHVGAIFSSTNWRIRPRRHLVSTGRSNGTHFKGVDVCFEGTISGAPGFN